MEASSVDPGALVAELASESRPVLFIPNPGNAGDALIAHATRQMLDRSRVVYQWVRDIRKLDPTGRVVVYGGGGNLTPLYSDARRALQWANGRARRLILLPHTVQGHEDLLAELGPGTDLFCRERVSYEHVRRSVRAARCHLADDLAFSADVRSTLADAPARLHPRFLDRVLHRSARALARKLRGIDRIFAERPADARTLAAFRTDAEGTGIPIPTGNLDLSSLFDLGTGSPDLCHAAARFLLLYLGSFEEVRTDRLHVAIGAALLGKRVEFHANSYFKNRAVFEFSMHDRFPNVRWASAETARRSPSG